MCGRVLVEHLATSLLRGDTGVIFTSGMIANITPRCPHPRCSRWICGGYPHTAVHDFYITVQGNVADCLIQTELTQNRS